MLAGLETRPPLPRHKAIMAGLDLVEQPTSILLALVAVALLLLVAMEVLLLVETAALDQLQALAGRQ